MVSINSWRLFSPELGRSELDSFTARRHPNRPRHSSGSFSRFFDGTIGRQQGASALVLSRDDFQAGLPHSRVQHCVRYRVALVVNPVLAGVSRPPVADRPERARLSERAIPAEMAVDFRSLPPIVRRSELIGIAAEPGGEIIAGAYINGWGRIVGRVSRGTFTWQVQLPVPPSTAGKAALKSRWHTFVQVSTPFGTCS